MVDNGYDISDYTGINPAFGTLGDMEELIAEAKQRDIRIVMDLVYNHGSDQHPWFIESKASYTNPKSDWYIWCDAITYIKKPATFEDGTPDSADGMVSVHTMTANTPGILDFLHEFRREVFHEHDIFTVGEANGVSVAELPDWVGENGVFSMLFEFAHVLVPYEGGECWSKMLPWPLTKLKGALSASQAGVAKEGWYPIYFENHDRARFVNYFFPHGGDTRLAAKALASVLMTLRGTPFIYEGEELGMSKLGQHRRL